MARSDHARPSGLRRYQTEADTGLSPASSQAEGRVMTSPREGGARPKRPGPRPLTLVICLMAAMSAGLMAFRLRHLGLDSPAQLGWILAAGGAFMLVEVLPL